MAAIVYSTSPSRVSSTNQNQYGSYGSVNKSMLSSQIHHQSQHHHTTMHPMSSPAPLSIYQGKDPHHSNYYTMQMHPMSHRNYKRKSAVEILNQTKSYYVKSETVLDHHQQLGPRGGGSNTLSCEYLVLKKYVKFFKNSLKILFSSFNFNSFILFPILYFLRYILISKTNTLMCGKRKS